MAIWTPANQPSPDGLGFHTVRGGIDPRDHFFRPRVVGVIDFWKRF